MESNPYFISRSIEKIKNSDKDIVFMATIDLLDELQKSSIVQLEEDIGMQVIDSVIGLLKEKNGEVQNLGVKCLVSFIKKCKNSYLEIIISTLCSFFDLSKEVLEGNGLRDIFFFSS